MTLKKKKLPPLRLRDLGPETIAKAKLEKETSRKNQLQ
jgi:hypothetical protein